MALPNSLSVQPLSYSLGSAYQQRISDVFIFLRSK